MDQRIGRLPRAVVITGGAGYIGSIISHHLVELGYRVVIIDKKPLPQALVTYNNVQFFQGDCADSAVWQKVVSHVTCDVVIHCAAFIEVGESVVKPAEYYGNNVATLIAMLDILRDIGVSSIIAASSSAVYGNPCELPIPEHHQRAPLSPYARTKVMLEDIVTDYHRAYGLNVVLLRFANVAGALPKHGLGECHEPETHLIPRLTKAAQQGEPFLLYGTDHGTSDGTCVRDFVHVYDVARLHSMLLNVLYAQRLAGPVVLNVGSGVGTSVGQMIDHVGKITGKPVITQKLARRAGDAPSIVLDIQAAYQLVGWKPLMSDIGTIVSSAYEFHRNHERVMSPLAPSRLPLR